MKQSNTNRWQRMAGLLTRSGRDNTRNDHDENNNKGGARATAGAASRVKTKHWSETTNNAEADRKRDDHDALALVRAIVLRLSREASMRAMARVSVEGSG